MTAKSNVDLVLVNPGNRSQIYQVLSSTIAAIEPPVWAGLMATFVRQKGFSVQIIDATAEEITHDQTAERVRELNPRLTAIVVYGQQPSASTQVMPGAGAVASALRKKAPDMPIIMAHPSFPWQDEAISICLHKPQVYIDLSGWSPKYFSPTLVQYANTLLKHKVLFGSDYPLIAPDRWMADFEKIAIKDEVRPLILKENAMRLFGLN